jgi:DNA-binding IclR family transcriptional regulator
MIQSVERAAAILRVLGSGTPRLGVTEIAGRVGLPKPTVYGLLRTLVHHDLVAQDPDTGKYSLGAGVLQLGNAFLDGSELRARSLLWAEALAQRANEAVWVATLSGSRVIVLHHVFRPDNGPRRRRRPWARRSPRSAGGAMRWRTRRRPSAMRG